MTSQATDYVVTGAKSFLNSPLYSAVTRSSTSTMNCVKQGTKLLFDTVCFSEIQGGTRGVSPVVVSLSVIILLVIQEKQILHYIWKVILLLKNGIPWTSLLPVGLPWSCGYASTKTWFALLFRVPLSINRLQYMYDMWRNALRYDLYLFQAYLQSCLFSRALRILVVMQHVNWKSSISPYFVSKRNA